MTMWSGFVRPPYEEKPSPERLSAQSWFRKKIAAVSLVVGILLVGPGLYLLFRVGDSAFSLGCTGII